ncbi:hypothetical protein D3C86_1686780 [compost metagenome]
MRRRLTQRDGCTWPTPWGPCSVARRPCLSARPAACAVWRRTKRRRAIRRTMKRTGERTCPSHALARPTQGRSSLVGGSRCPAAIRLRSASLCAPVSAPYCGVTPSGPWCWPLSPRAAKASPRRGCDGWMRCVPISTGPWLFMVDCLRSRSSGTRRSPPWTGRQSAF